MVANHRPSCLVKCISYAVLKIIVGYNRKAIVGKMCHCIACLQKKTNSHWSTRHVLTFWNHVCAIRGVIHLHLQVLSPVKSFPVTLRMSHSICQAPACLRHFTSTVNVVFPFHSSFDLYVTCMKQ